MANILITGGNGAGKTCYVVAKLMSEQVGRTIVYEDEHEVEHEAKRRIVAAGFRKLLVEHEKIPHPLVDDPENCWTKSDVDRWNRETSEGFPVMERKPFSPPVLTEIVGGVERPLVPCLFNWWLWVMPGDYVCIDEMQFVVPRGIMGRTPPLWMRKIEIHRHYGMDWLWITPHVQLLDMNLRALATEHRHVRAVRFFPKLAMVYVWDHVSNVERITQATKEKFVKKSKYFKLYKSTASVMKQATPGRNLFLIAPVVLLAACGTGYYALNKAKGSPVAAAQAVAGAASSSTLVRFAPVLVGGAIRPPGYESVPKLAGCYTHGPVCRCFESPSFREVKVAPQMCVLSAGSYDGLVPWQARAELSASAPSYGAAAGVSSSASSPGGFPFKTF